MDDRSGDRRAKVSRAVEDWVAQLVNLTGRNQLLYYRTLPRGTLELTKADQGGLQRLLAGGKVRISQLFRAGPGDRERLDDATARARTIHRRAVEHFEERGVRTLFVGWGMASWQATRTRTSSTPCAPVLLRPLRLEPTGAIEADFDLSLDGDWEVSATLLHLFATEFSLRLDAAALLEGFGDEESAASPDPRGLFARLLREGEDVPSLAIDPRVVAGTFLYTKLPMVQDLQGSLDQLAAHDIIAALAGVEEARDAVMARHARHVDPSDPDTTAPADEFLVLDADASQNHAINAALAGESLIIQGPPGTGKSQTIANLIAALTARGRRVLFVAEKRAAIDAVTKRLDGVGLGGLVMDLHGGVTSKRQLAADLGSSLAAMRQTPAVDLADLHYVVEISRDHLAAHVAALHQHRDPFGLSLWEVRERLLELPEDAVTRVRLVGSVLLQLDAATARKARTLLAEYAHLAAPILERRSPWADAKVSNEAEAKSALNLARALAADTVPAARRQLNQVLVETGLPTPDTVDAWRQTLGLLSAVAQTLGAFSPSLWDLDLAQLIDDLSPAAQSAWSRAIAQLCNSRYRAAKGRLRAVAVAESKQRAYDLRAAAVAALAQAREWTVLDGQGLPRTPADLLGAESVYQALTEDLAALGAYLVTHEFCTLDMSALEEDIARLAADHGALFRLPRIHQIGQWLRAHALEGLLDALSSGDVAPAALVATFDYAWLSSIASEVISRDPQLASFDGTLQTGRALQFARADAEHLDVTPTRVLRAVTERAYAARDEYRGQSQRVEVEAKKKRGHLSLRRLFEQAPDVLTALRPCWVMSPLVVAETLPARRLFDVVIFDEASQVMPADAVPALMRASQAIVAGDDRQLPPTSFFDGADSEDGADDDDGVRLVQGFESVLDTLGALLRPYLLTWHYRSRDERLIAFSNAQLYGGALTTFPGVADGDCLEHVLVPHRPGARIDTRSSDDEVARVVDLMVEHAGTRSDESLGVIAMGSYHADRIDAALRARLRMERDPAIAAFFDESREERAFVKNLERVQGDERDAIILSIGYGKQPDGRLLYRFGPLIQEGGERRLNVAVTRARKRMTVVSSFSHTDMDPGRSPAQGAKLLRHYLKFVQSGGVEIDRAKAVAALNPFELSVQTWLEKAGLRVIPQYGASGFRIDFAVCHPTVPGRLVLAVEADGASYHRIPTVRDRDRLRQKVLEDLGWRFHRIWSTDWFNDPATETAKVVAAYEQAVAACDAVPAPSQGSHPVNHWQANGRGVAMDKAPARRGPRPPVQRGQKIGEYTDRQLAALADWIRSDTLLRTEEELIDALMAELGFTRRGKIIVATLRRAAARASGPQRTNRSAKSPQVRVAR